MDTQQNLKVNRSYGYYEMISNKRHSDKDTTTNPTTANSFTEIMSFNSEKVLKYKLSLMITIIGTA